MKGLIGMILGVIFLFGVALPRLVNQISSVGEIAKVEQLRQDIQKVNVGENEDVVGQVTQWNQRIKYFNQYRQYWWGKIYIPSIWEQVEVIELDKKKEKK